MEQQNGASALPSVMALAYLGDSVHELYVRRLLVARGLSRSKDLNGAALSYVTAQAQAQMADRVLPDLTEAEENVFRRACNSHHINRPKNASGRDYRHATGWEAVLGMLFVTGQTARLEQLLAMADPGFAALVGGQAL